MNELQILKAETFGNVKCDFWQTEDGDVLLTREQIGKALEYKHPQKAIGNLHSRNYSRLRDHVVDLKLRGTDGKMYSTALYTAKGVYEICRASGQPKADEFMDWVWEVLESIRKYGMYATDELINNPDLLIKVATALKEERAKRVEAERFSKQIAVSQNSLLVREVAKIASKENVIIGEKRLWKKLREWGLIFKNTTEPMQEYVDRGYFEVVEGAKETYKGTFTYRTTRVTGKGQVYIIKRLIKEQEEKP